MSFFRKRQQDRVRIERLENAESHPKTTAGAVVISALGGTLPQHDHAGTGDGGVLTGDKHDSYGEYAAISTPSTPAAGSARLYAKTVSAITRIFAKRDDGTEIELATASSPTFGSPVKIGTANSDGTGTDVPHANHVHDGLGEPQGLTGATAATRYVGGTASGAPATGTFAVGDVAIDQTGVIWICTGAGSPGTWIKIGGAGGGSTFTQRKWFNKSELHGIAATSTQVGTLPDQQGVWQFASAASNSVQWDWQVPPEWDSGAVTVILHYAKTSSGSGNIFHRLNYDQQDVGDSVAETGTNSDQTVAVAADPQQTRQIITWSSLFTPSAAGEVWRFNYARIGGDAADTYAGTSWVIGVEFQYTAR